MPWRCCSRPGEWPPAVLRPSWVWGGARWASSAGCPRIVQCSNMPIYMVDAAAASHYWLGRSAIASMSNPHGPEPTVNEPGGDVEWGLVYEQVGSSAGSAQSVSVLRTVCPLMDARWLQTTFLPVSSAVWKRSGRWTWTMWRSCHGVAARGRPLGGASLVEPEAWKRWQSL